MNYLKVRHKNGTTKFKIPSNWNECTYGQFLLYLEHKADRLKVYEIFTGVSAEIWAEPNNPELFLNMDLQLNFISELPVGDKPDIINRGGVFYPIPKKLLKISYGKYSDLLTLYQAAGTNQLKIMQNTPLMIAIFACVDYDTDDELKEIAEEIKLMPANQGYVLASFFLTKLNQSNLGMPKLALRQKMTRHILRPVLTYLVLALVLVYSLFR